VIIACLICNYDYRLELLTPGGKGCWGNVQFTTDPIPKADYLISLNYPPESFEIVCPKEHCWALIQEPPSTIHSWLHTSHPSFSRLYSCDARLRGPHRVLSPPYLPWLLSRSYDWLKEATPPSKNIRSLNRHKFSLLDGRTQASLQFFDRTQEDRGL
jgi:hypothetical protein